MPNVAAGLGLLGLGVMVVVAVGTIAYSLFYDQPHHQEDYSHVRSNERDTWNVSDSSAPTRTVRRKKKERASSEFSDLCSICKEIIEKDALKKLPCHHCFHYKCIYDWFDTCADSVLGTGTCPMCREKFSARDLI